MYDFIFTPFSEKQKCIRLEVAGAWGWEKEWTSKEIRGDFGNDAGAVP